MRWRVVVASSVVMLGLIAGCSEPTPAGKLPPKSSSSTASGSASASPSQTLSAEQQAVADAYKGWYSTILTIGGMSDDQIRAALAPYGTPVLLDWAVARYHEIRAQNKVPAGTATFSTLEITFQGEIAIVQECRDSSTEGYADANSGAMVGQGPSRNYFVAIFERGTESQWLLKNFIVEETECDPS